MNLLKYPGGKERELKYILSNLPKFNNYFEPFVQENIDNKYEEISQINTEKANFENLTKRDNFKI